MKPGFVENYTRALRQYAAQARIFGLGIGSEPMPLGEIYVESRVHDAALAASGSKRSRAAHFALWSGTAESAASVLGANSHVAILGEPGQGKTTLLRQYACQLSEEQIIRRLPLLVELGRERERVPAPTRDFSWLKVRLPDALRVLIDESAWKEICNALSRGRIYLLLDGFDELTEGARQQVTELLPGLSQNPIAITARPHSYRIAPLAGFKIYALQQLGWAQVQFLAEQVCKAIAKQFGSRDYDLPFRTVLETCQNDTTGMSRNPLLLSFMCLTAVKRSSEGRLVTLPKCRAGLISECVEALVAWQRQKTPKVWPDELFAFGVVRILSQLALNTFKQGSGIIGEEAIDALSPEDRRILIEYLLPARFVEAQDGGLAFPLETFREYFAARAIAATREPFLVVEPYLHVPEWRQVILYTAGCLDHSGASRLDLLLPPVLTHVCIRGVGVVGKVIVWICGGSRVGQVVDKTVDDLVPSIRGFGERWLARSRRSTQFFVMAIVRHSWPVWNTLSWRMRHYEKILRRDLRLAVECQANSEHSSPALMKRLVASLVPLLSDRRWSLRLAAEYAASTLESSLRFYAAKLTTGRDARYGCIGCIFQRLLAPREPFKRS